MRALAAAFRVGFAHVFAYRAEAAIQLLSSLLVVGLNGSLWLTATRGRTEIAGVPATEMMAYVVIAWVGVSCVATRVNDEMGRRIRDGQIVAELLRPTSVFWSMWARDLGRACATFLVQTTPLFVVCALLLPMRWPTSWTTWPLWLGSLGLAHATNFGLSFLVGLAAFKLGNITGLTHLKGTLISVFSGALIPLELYAAPVRAVLLWLPFHALAHTPAGIFLERPGSVIEALGGQLAWAVGLWATSALLWRRAVGLLTVQGG